MTSVTVRARADRRLWLDEPPNRSSSCGGDWLPGLRPRGRFVPPRSTPCPTPPAVSPPRKGAPASERQSPQDVGADQGRQTAVPRRPGHSPEGHVWAARAGWRALPNTGFDRYADGQGEMRWLLRRIRQALLLSSWGAHGVRMLTSGVDDPRRPLCDPNPVAEVPFQARERLS